MKFYLYTGCKKLKEIKQFQAREAAERRLSGH